MLFAETSLSGLDTTDYVVVVGYILLTIGIGAGHIVLGLMLGVWISWRRHERHDLIEKLATLVSLAALFLLAAVLADFLPDALFTPAVALLVVGLAILIYSLGNLGFLLGPLELLSTIGNILSYLRIAAIGLSSVYLAQVANELAGSLGNVLVGLIVFGDFPTPSKWFGIVIIIGSGFYVFMRERKLKVVA